MSRKLLFAVTSHGWGHLTRVSAIANAVAEADPGIELILATRIDEALIARDLRTPFTRYEVDYEPGTLQRNCFELDVPGTREAYRRWQEQRGVRLAQEVDALRALGCDAVVSDIPALPVRAAAELGLPAFGVANFTWDWILEPLLADGPAAAAVSELAADYASGRHHLRLPFGPESSPFPGSEPAPLVSRQARLSPPETRRLLGLPEREEAKLVVVCPGGWEPEGWQPIHLDGLAGLRFVTVGDLPITADAPLLSLPHSLAPGLLFPDLVAAADVVVAKPGYGIASECAVHGSVPIAIERPGFRETPVLLEQCRRIGPTPELSLEDFFAGRWDVALEAAVAATWAPQRSAGPRRIAERLLELIAEALG